MNRKIAAVLAVLIMVMLSGCQLAVAEDTIPGASKNALCGVLVTLEPLDTGMEETIEIPPGWNGNLDAIVFPEERIYATRTVSDDVVDYSFDGVDGYRLFAAIEQIEGMQPYWATYSDEEIQNRSTNIMSGVNEEMPEDTVALTGTILFDVHEPCRVYANPVYQTPKGEIYVVQGQGLWMDELQTEGSCGSMELSATTTETVGDSTSSRTLDVEINVEGVNPNERIVLRQMDAQDKVLERTEITKGSIPESIRLLAETAYMMLEEHGVDFEGKAFVKRTVLAADEEQFGARFAGEKGIILSYPVTLEPAAGLRQDGKS